MLRKRWLAAALLLGSACSAGDDSAASGAGSDIGDDIPEDIPTGQVGELCRASSDCDQNLVCVAEFSGDRGAFHCEAACIPTLDESQWCTDAASCCAFDATCTNRGYCVVPDDGNETGDVGTSTGASGSNGSSGGSSGGTGAGTAGSGG